MNELALFAGAGGGILASKLLGHRVVCAVEINPYCASVLLQRQNDLSIPAFPIWDDVRTFDGFPWNGRIDVVSGGFPCQAFSSAASGKNNADDLWPEMRRVVADVAPRYVFAENVSKDAINNAANDLEEMGYEVRCTQLSAKDMGADHIRERFWLLAHANMHSKLRSPIDAKVGFMPGVRSSVWETYPDEPRMDDGLAYRMDRLKATGNGQVPIVAATAFLVLLEHLMQDKNAND